MTAVSGLLAILLLAANAFFVAAEFALVAASKARLEVLAEGGNRRARAALGAKRDMRMHLAGVQLGNTMASLGLGFLVEPAVAELLDPLLGGIGRGFSVAVSIAIVVVMHVLFGELVPKNAALSRPDALMMRLAPALRLFVGMFRPFIWGLDKLAVAGARLCGVRPSEMVEASHSTEDIFGLLSASRGEGLIDEFEHSLLVTALDLGKRPVSSVMVPRSEIVGIPRSASAAEAERMVVSSGHSRLLVGDLDWPDGFVHAKDLLAVEPRMMNSPVPSSCIRPALVFPANATLEGLLLQMRRMRIHLAVIREGSETVGLLTLEDALELLVGEIRDESDVG